MAWAPVKAPTTIRDAMSRQLSAVRATPSAWIAATWRFNSPASQSPESFLPRSFMSISPWALRMVILPS
jgi:hypothetical protein